MQNVNIFYVGTQLGQVDNLQTATSLQLDSKKVTFFKSHK